jgi:hypothetical protein
VQRSYQKKICCGDMMKEAVNTYLKNNCPSWLDDQEMNIKFANIPLKKDVTEEAWRVQFVFIIIYYFL